MFVTLTHRQCAQPVLEDDAVVVSQTAEEWEQVSSHRIRLNSKASIDALINALTEFREYI